MKILRLQAEGFKRLKAIDIKPKNNVVKIKGKNKQGKTSVLDCIWVGLGGDKAAPKRPIRDGEQRAPIILDLGETETDFIVKRVFTPGGSRIEVTNKEGFEAKSPQKLLDSFLGKFTFDPLEFMKMDDRPQFDFLLSIAELSFSKDALKEAIDNNEIVGGENSLEIIANTRKAIYERRTDVNRDAKSAESRANGIEIPEELQNTSFQNLNDLLSERKELEKLAEENSEIRHDLKLKEKDVLTLEDELKTRQSVIDNLEAQLAEEKKKLRVVSDRLKVAKSEYETVKEDADSLVDPDLSEIDSRIKFANEAQEWKNKAELKTSLMNEFSILSEKSRLLSQSLTAIDNFKTNLLSKAKFPLDGLGVQDGIVTFNDIPLSQASDAEQLLVSTKIAMSLNPKIRVIRIRDGSLLDDDSMALLEKLANENDFQIWIEIVSSEPGGGVYIFDGEVAG